MSRYHELLAEMSKTFEAKDADYAGGVPFGNFRHSEALGIPAWKGAALRLSDKFYRFVSLTQRPAEVTDESIGDTLLDLANYALIVRCLLEER